MGPLTLNRCVQKLEMPASKKFRLMQIRNFLLSIWKAGPEALRPYEKWCSEIRDQRGGISLTETSGKPSYALAWEQDLNIDWNTETWYQQFSRSFKDIANV